MGGRQDITTEYSGAEPSIRLGILAIKSDGVMMWVGL